MQKNPSFISNNLAALAAPTPCARLRPLIVAFALGTLLQTGNTHAETNKPLGRINDYLRLTGELNGSYEVWNFFQPDPAENNNNSYDLWVLRARLGIEMKTSFIDGFAQAQYIGMYGLPDDAVAVPGGPLGLGAAYYYANGATSTDPGEVFLRQAYFNFKSEPLGLPGGFLKIGRFEFMDGIEYQTGNVKFDAVKKARIGQRLVGSNAVHVTRTFDGFSAVYDQPAFNVTVSGMRPTQGGFNAEGQDEISDIDLFYTALTSKMGALLPGTEGRLFYLRDHDDRHTQAVDNRASGARPFLDIHDLEIHTIGTHLLTLQKLGSGSTDALLWGAYQFGDWTDQQHQAWAVDAEAGYQWTELPLKPWLRAVYYRSSGDGNAKDGKHETFYSVLPSGRLFAKFPFYNLMNIQDAFIELIVAPTPSTKVTVDLHQLSLTDSNDLFYSGLGATSTSGAFGFQGRPTGGDNDVGQLVDIMFTHTVSKELSWRFYYGHAFGGNVIKNFYKGQRDADTAWIDFNLVF